MPARANWKQGSRGPTTRSKKGAPAESDRGFREGGRPDPLQRRFRYYAGMIATLAIIVAALIAWFYIIRPRNYTTPLLVLGVHNYAAPLPPNAWIDENVRAMNDASQNLIAARQSVPASLTAQDLANVFTSYVREQEPGGHDKNVLLIYLTAHGAVDAANRPCLLAADANPRDDSTWLPVEDLLGQLIAELQERRAANNRPIHVVLFLEAGGLRPDWTWGFLYNDFNRRLDEVVAKLASDQLHVLNSSSPRERSWSSPELGAAAFTYFLSRGLAGEADNPPDSDSQVSLTELELYLRRSVAPWVRMTRGASQRPVTLGSTPEAGKIRLAYVDRDAVPPLSQSDELFSRLQADQQRLQGSWSRLSAARQLYPPAEQFYPTVLAKAQRLLLRCEALSLAGGAYRSEFDATLKEADRLIAELGKPSSLELAVHSLPQALRNKSDASAARDLYEGWRIANGPPPAEKEGQEPPPPPYLQAAFAVWNYARQAPTPPTREQLRQWLDYIDKAQPRASERRDLIEVHFLRMLVDYLDADAVTRQWPAGVPELAQQAIQVRHEAEVAAALQDGVSGQIDSRTQYAVQNLVDQGDELRRRAEDLLFVGQTDEVPGLLQESAARYRDAQTLNTVVAKAFALRDRAWADLGYLGYWVEQKYLQDGDPLQAKAMQLWFQLADELSLLAVELDKAESTDPSALDVHNQRVERLYDQIRNAYQASASALARPAPGDGEIVRQIELVLQLPLLDPDRRQALQRKYLLSLDSFAKSRDSFRLEDNGNATPVSPEDWSYLQQPISEKLPHHPVLSLLERRPLDQLSPDKQLPVMPPGGKVSDVPAQLAAIGGEVRRVLRGPDRASSPGASATEAMDRERYLDAVLELQDRTHESLVDPQAQQWAGAVRAGDSQADRLTRPLAALLPTAERDARTGDDPAARLARLDEHFACLWRAHRALEDFWGAPRNATIQEPPYFASAAQQALQDARRVLDADRRLSSETIVLRYRDTANLPELLRLRQQSSQFFVQNTGEGVIGPVDPAPVTGELLGNNVEQTFRVTFPADVPPGLASFFVAAEQEPEFSVELFSPTTGKPQRRSPQDVLHVGPIELPLVLPSEAVAKGGLSAQVLFRGHLASRGFRFLQLAPRQLVQINLPQPVQTSVVVNGGLIENQLMFILDCSRSMNGQKMDSAKDALTKILNLLFMRNEGLQGRRFEVGLRAYGHRLMYGGNRVQNGNLVGVNASNPINENDITYADGNPPPAWQWPKVWPDTDVQRIQGLVELDQNIKDQLVARVRSLKPWGLTPLRLALQQALQQDFPSNEGLIVLLTDGENFVTPFCPINQNPTEADVKTERRNHPQVRIVILGLALGGAEQRVKKFAAELGAKYFSAQAQDLERKLLDAILGKYSVGRTPQSGDEDLIFFGETQALTDVPPLGAEYEVRVDTSNQRPPKASLWLQGGEAVSMSFSPENGLLFDRFQRIDFRGEKQEVQDANGRAYIVQAIKPQRLESGKDVLFSAYMQAKDASQFTRRPRHVWAKIQPLSGLQGDRLAGSPYYFQDLDFQPERPVPVLRFTAKDWPAEATHASLELFLHFDDPANLAGPWKIVDGGSFDQLSGVQLDVAISRREGKYYVQIKELQRGVRPADEPPPVYFQLQPPPDAVRRQYFSGGRGEHVFVYQADPGEVYLRAASPQTLQQGALTPGRLVVRVED